MSRNWQAELLHEARAQLADVEQGASIHLAIMAEPFLGLLRSGEKTVESRFSVNRCAPWGRVNAGDVVLLKGVGEPVKAAFCVASVWSFDLGQHPIAEVNRVFAKAICADEAFWQAKANAKYATLMGVGRQTTLRSSIEVHKPDRRGWVVLSDGAASSLILGFDHG